MHSIWIRKREVGRGRPAYIIAEMSANHNGDLATAEAIIREAKKAGADAVKLQTYTADTMTIDASTPPFIINKGTAWDGRSLYDLYREAATPWEWHKRLKAVADDVGIDLFSTPFDGKAIELLESLDVPAYKVASFELIDHGLLRLIAAPGKPVIMSTGMATLDEIREAVDVLRAAGASQIALLKCTSAYPAPPEEANLATITHLSELFEVPTGLSDHTLGTAVAVTSVALGGCIIEKHFTISRAAGGPDSAFSLEPHEFARMVRDVREAEAAIGHVSYQPTPKELGNRSYRRSLFVVKAIQKGEVLTPENIRSIRPGQGLAPKYLDQVLGKPAACDLSIGTPLAWEHVGPKA